MLRVPFEVLDMNIVKLYPPHYVLSSNETIEEHLLYIETFIEACGWSVSEYMEEYIHRGLAEFLPPELNKEQN